MATYLEQFVSKLRGFEGSVPWMYLDTVGKVTVGVGMLLPTEAAALALPFLAGDRPATPEEIAAEFARVDAMKKGQQAPFYRLKNGLHLSDATIEERLTATAQGLEGYLHTHLPGYALLPDAAKVALLDMVYNLGPGRLFAEYPQLLAAIGRGDWRAAAAASSRRGPGPERNAWTRDQFLLAAKEAVHAIQARAEGGGGWIAFLLAVAAGFGGAAAVGALLAGGAGSLPEPGGEAKQPTVRPIR